MKLYTLDSQFIEEIGFYEHVPFDFTGIGEWEDNTKLWFKNGKQHREDGPAIEWFNGSKQWCHEDKLHRLDGPAIEWHDGTKEYFVFGNKCSSKEHNLLVSIMKLKGLL